MKLNDREERAEWRSLDMAGSLFGMTMADSQLGLIEEYLKAQLLQFASECEDEEPAT